VRTHAFAHLRRFAPDSLRHVGNRETLAESRRVYGTSLFSLSFLEC
jgi:hypothetical protein